MEVIDIETDMQEIALDNEMRFSYDKLLIANGTSNFILPIEGIEKENVYTIRKLSDIQDIKANIEDKKAVLIVGGGIQGLETAWVLHQHGMEVIVVEALERLMPRQIDSRASEILRKAIEDFNIKLILNTQIKEITGLDAVEGVATKNGDIIKCDMIIYSVGIRPNKKLLENTPVKSNHGIIINNKMQSNVKNVYAAGDTAELYGKLGRLWGTAIEQGKIAGYNITGRESVYTGSVPVTMMNAFNISLFSAGDIDENSCDLTLTDDNSEGLTYKSYL
ncbi:NAD(P)/FAD-dependent oxidoreductase [Clostridium sp. YIM B02515]|uniref:NAD(P)/FAD-dependent oxidoreductase n=2 Tax=Clostridium rhizosphaerae TaxID=2803861 RepID=A0ABS1TFR6_9CLOT|nr:NAD(P)/FAD-dependent oxidoreductase [Clostridium rhizosphaerae]